KPFSRDKDAIQMIPLLIKYKNLLANNGTTFKDTMEDIYAHIGSYKDKTLSHSFEGAEGVEKISKIMNQFRNNEVSTICDLEVKQIEDYEMHTNKNIKESSTERLTLPKTNSFRVIFENGFISLRASGTEPKIKLY